ncbi:non-hydrolyzing UDP-N-acetylglucosamine 2-epimerase [Streptomyces roseus]|uniref:non-hydrolyzing UDP-N-acetylglucosamine 2-epimerase n=1 Tax=Streptomyces roseus TaxID=66430 RepID=UPI0037F64D83
MVLGTRPETIKLATVIRKLGEDVDVIHTGQHYDDALFRAHFSSLDLPNPTLCLSGVGGEAQSYQIENAIPQILNYFERSRPKVAVVQGDTNAASAGAQAANFLKIPLIHVEAGLRSYDEYMPEEINRRLISMLADIHCAPTGGNVRNLIREGVPVENIRMTGNTIVEAIAASMLPDGQSLHLLDDFGLSSGGYVLATVHRPENTDDSARLDNILKEFAMLPLPVVFPVHPRTASCVERFGLQSRLRRLECTPPLDHPTFLALARHSRVLVSDSGGIQEECTVLKKPLIILRDNTERPEVIESGFAMLVSARCDFSRQIKPLLYDDAFLHSLASKPCPFGDGKASDRIVEIIQNIAHD